MTPKEKKDTAKWIGEGPAPHRNYRFISVLYRLSQEGQREAFLTTVHTSGRSIYSDGLSCAQIQRRQLTYDKDVDEYKDAFELAYLDENGDAYVFIGGAEAFPPPDDKGEWTARDKALGKWRMKKDYSREVPSSWGVGEHPLLYIKQVPVAPLSFDDPTISTHNLLDAEVLRRFEIEQSKTAAEVEVEAEEKRRDKEDEEAHRRAYEQYTR